MSCFSDLTNNMNCCYVVSHILLFKLQLVQKLTLGMLYS